MLKCKIMHFIFKLKLCFRGSGLLITGVFVIMKSQKIDIKYLRVADKTVYKLSIRRI